MWHLGVPTWRMQMYLNDYWLVKRSMDLRLEGALCQAEVHRLLCEAGFAQYSWPSRLGRRLLGRLGHLLVILGERLARYGTPQPQLLGGECAVTPDCGSSLS